MNFKYYIKRVGYDEYICMIDSIYELDDYNGNKCIFYDKDVASKKLSELEQHFKCELEVMEMGENNMRGIRKTVEVKSSSFHDVTITRTLNQLISVLGKPSCSGDIDDKVQFEWELETLDCIFFTIYDWKEYRKFDDDEMIEWYIGGSGKLSTERALKELIYVLDKGELIQ